ncbi:hypothetical protein JCM17846_18610 [Iodidimonas nitroreducens]|uniref:Uncharacterized protein n=1 Tax=Iodidimonas nitroreducens TaxID=1236968 RepID=A0A5A7NAX3_9PROT|nr:hypothetical protein [Iodidimonas nitroreducens]GAK33242.1 hypothetical protein AQ1_01129 [alpha proteobacterium Q-1]GER04179.1 hypothetical protein JCM17846_18610 [Iodidimonas nitroreducens]
MTDIHETGVPHGRVTKIESTVASLVTDIKHVTDAVSSLAETVGRSSLSTKESIDRIAAENRSDMERLRDRVAARERPQWQVLIAAVGLMMAMGSAALWPVWQAGVRAEKRLDDIDKWRLEDSYANGRRDERLDAMNREKTL